jgi:separase
LARVTLKVTDPGTFIPAFELLSQATSILNTVLVHDSPSPSLSEEVVDIANYTRCISGAFYNLAGILYRGTRYGNAVPFLLESCTLAEKALSFPRSPESMTETKRKEWTQLEEQLYRRWELLGVCYSKNSDRRVRFFLAASCCLTLLARKLSMRSSEP